MQFKPIRSLALLCAAALPFVPLARASGDTTMAMGGPVSADKLSSAATDSDQWLTYGRDLSATRHSPLAQIDTGTVGKLKVAWKKSLGPPISMEGTPIVNNGVMYVTTGISAIFALNAKTGATIWQYHYPLPAVARGRVCCNINNRGVTLTGNKVIFGTLDAHLVALDAGTGKVLWNTTVANNALAYSITSPPLPVKNMVLTGVGGGEYPTRGFIAAYSADTGKFIWRRYTVPGPGEPGYNTWKNHLAAKTGGGPTWLPGTYDPARNTVYWGTGNPNPDWDTNSVPGDLLFTSALIAMDADTGKIKWYYQFTPHDIWDYDGVNEPMLVDVPLAGGQGTTAAIAHADRNGYLYLINRDTGKLIYAVPFLNKVTWGKVDRTTGKITFDPKIQALAKARKNYDVAPAVIGGKNWEPTAYDPARHLFFIPALESSITMTAEKASVEHPKPGVFNFGGFVANPKFAGSISAWDLTTGKMVWKKPFRSPAFGGALSTGGGLVFVGQLEGELDALDATTGKTLWHVKTKSGINAPPSTYALDGQQYVAVESGIGGVWPLFFMPVTPWLKAVPPASLIYTYKLPAGVGSMSMAAPSH